MEKIKKYKVIINILTIILVIDIVGGILFGIFKGIESRKNIKENISSKLTEEELNNINMKELVDDIIGDIKHAKRKDKKESSNDLIVQVTPYYEGDGYTIEQVGGGEWIGYIYYYRDKQIYTKSKSVPLESIKDGKIRFFKENKNKIIYFIILILLFIIDIVFIKLHKMEKIEK